MKFNRCLLGFCLGALGCLLVACGKEEETTEVTPATPEAGAPAVPAPAPGPVTPAVSSGAGLPPGAPYDVVVAGRTIEFVQNQIARKNFSKAREAIATLDPAQLTPAQRQMIDKLKAQLPPQ